MALERRFLFMVLTPSRDSTDPPAEAIAALRSGLQGSLVRPADADYDAARQVWNACIDRRPALIVRAASTGDVVAAVDFARSHRLPLAVRGGGHSLAGYGTCDAGLVLDLRGLNNVTVDADARVARAGGGVIGREFGAATLAHGLATPTGQVPTTGLAGVALGGGVGWLTRKYGLTCYSMLSAEVVT